ncbi:MAG TPA: LUD domain-containing protein [Candidatus Angelobacter sp.]|nr:LUD domain-containing protein [Candidatus Angelobacter sp.]
MATANNPSRDLILKRIRAGLQMPVTARWEEVPERPFFAPIENPLERFQQECKANLMELTLTDNAAESARQLASILNTLPPGEIFMQDHAGLRALVEDAGVSREIRWSSQGGPREVAQATVSLAEALVAHTGSVFVSAACGGRGASVVAPCHIVFANTNQLLPDLKTALSNATRNGVLKNNSFACMISGSSRTADIEKILVQGAHGPIRLAVILERR